jgi:hypothetical protein
MTYTDFNKYIHDLCLKRENIGETIILSIDDSIIQSFCVDFNTSVYNLQECIKRKFQYGWTLALKTDDNIPQFFGLLAVQVYVAHLMHKDEEYTANAYNPRLSTYLDISKQSLQSLYRDFQDDLWEGLKTWGSKNDITFLIPSTELGSWRYVKYPISQALLNQEDLKKLPFLFQAIGLRPNESVSFDDFRHLINESDKIPRLTRHYHQVKSKLRDLNKEDAVLYQIYDYYSKWDGNHDSTPPNDSENKKPLDKTERELSYLALDDNFLFIDVFNHRDERLERWPFNDSELPQKLSLWLNASDDTLLIFERDRFYDSWVNTRYLKQGKKHLILSKKRPHLETAISKMDPTFRNVPHALFSIFEVTVDIDFEAKGFWKQYFSKKHLPFEFVNGLMLARDVWMQGNGPTIIFYLESKAWLNGTPINMDSTYSFSCQNHSEGEYRLKVAGFAPVSFSIQNARNNPFIFTSTGWQVDIGKSQWSPAHLDFSISGLFTTPSHRVTEAPVRDWIDALTSKCNTSESDIIVIKAIQRKRHGHLRY